jgi:ribosomal protein S18 acetylase RimI-like enzyme
MPVLKATLEDIPQLVALLNAGYRGNLSKAGWTTEANIIEGTIRTDYENVKELMLQPGAIFLKTTNHKNEIEACVFLQKKINKLYLGMLCVSPLLQAKGTGKQLMAAAVKHATELGCVSIFMKVISIRHELIAWYQKQGYINTGIKEPFPTDEKFGKPLLPIEFIILEKTI